MVKYRIIVEPVSGTEQEAEEIADDIRQSVMRRNPLDEPFVHVGSYDDEAVKEGEIL